LQARESFLFPAIDLYLRQPSEQNWKIVREAVLDDLEQVKTSVRLAIEFDSQFYEVGSNILTIASDGTELVDQKYHNAFGGVRQIRPMVQQPVLNEMLASEARPTEVQVREWQAKLKETYTKLKSELQKLITLVQQRT